MPSPTSGPSKAPEDGLPFSICTRILAPSRSRIDVRGEIDIATSPQLNAALLRELLDAHDVELDLTQVTFMDASALGTILGARNRFERREHSLVVRLRAPSQPHRLLGLTGILPMLTVTDGASPEPPT